MKLNKTILLLILIAISTYSNARKKNEKFVPFLFESIEFFKNTVTNVVAGKYEVGYYKNDFYKICIKITDDSHLLADNNGCMKSFMQKKIIYNCDASAFEKLKEEKKFEGKSNLIVLAKKLPYDTILDVLKKTSCNLPENALNSKYKMPLLNKNTMRVRFINAILPSYDNLPKQFFEVGEDVASLNPLGKALEMTFFLEQLNLSEKLKARSSAPDSDSEPNPASLIELDSQNDLKIEKARLYLDKIIPNIYHEVLYLCVRNTDKNKAYHFIVDRSARDPTHEKDTWSAVANFFDLSAMSTLVRVIYYTHSETCDESETPDSKKFNPEFNLVSVGKDQQLEQNMKAINDFLNISAKSRTDKFKLAVALNENVASEKSSFRKFVVAIQRYALRYTKYNIYENCQHFATGFFNYLTNQNEEYVNVSTMKTLGSENINWLRTSKDLFDHFFTDEDDQAFEMENSKRISVNNKRLRK